MRVIRLLLLYCLVVASPAFGQPAQPKACPDSKILGASIINKVCWTCMFPIWLSAVEVGDGPVPEGMDNDVFCSCRNTLGIDVPGVPLSGWFPARLIELTRKPYCSPVLGGRTLLKGNRLWGGNWQGSSKRNVGGGGIFKNSHYYAFDLLLMLRMVANTKCSPGGSQGMDLLYMSEVDPTWNDNVLGFFLVPESIVFANPVALMACAVDCMAQSAAPNKYYLRAADATFWCAGCWGGIYPHGGFSSNADSPVDASSLIATRKLAALFRRGLARKTVGRENWCGGTVYPFLPKSQYRMQMMFPVSESAGNCCHRIGESTYRWGNWRNVPAVGEDQVYLLHRFTQCCMPFNITP